MKTSLKDLGIARLLRWGSALLARSGHAALAAQFFRAADELSPIVVPPFAYARSLWQEGQYEYAKSVLGRILAVIPSHAEANNLLGVLCLEEDQMEPARLLFLKALASRPNWEVAHNNLGNVHRAKDELADAERCYRAALSYKSDYVEALTNLGIVLSLQGQNDAAEAYCRRAVSLAPGFAGAHCNLGSVLLSLNRSGEAVAAYREALRIQPDIPEALVNLALILEDGGYLAGTIDYYERQLARRPGNYLANVRIAQALQALRRWDEARERLGKALEQKPEAEDALFVLGVNFGHIGDIRACLETLNRLLATGPHATAQIASAFSSMYLEDYSGEQLCSRYRDWAESYATRPQFPLKPKEAARPERRLRVGYVSRDFARHSVAYFLEPILRCHDHEHFEIYCYSTLIRGDNFTDRFKALADVWRDISTLSENDVVNIVWQDDIDILVDLSGHTTGNRLGVFAWKAASLQLSYLGHPATTGLTAIDYRLGDSITDPTGLTSGHYVERLWQLPGCFLTYQPPDDAPSIAPVPSVEKGYVTFGSFNNAAKINDSVVEFWAEILALTPKSRFLLKAYGFGSAHGRARVIERFAVHGIAGDRLDLIDWADDLPNHLALYREVDVALDPFPYNGTTTTCEALWMGVPVVCIAGQRHSARVGASLLTSLGLTDLLATNRRDYVDIAVALAGDQARLAALRSGLRETMRASPLLDHAAFTRKFEQAYREMWREYCRTRAEDPVEGNAAEPGEVKTVTLDLAGIAKICLPDSYEVMTRYVVDEQGDWFEEEIHFVRRLLMPGQVAIDVGANYGVYTLSMAAAIGSAGKLYAFEPDGVTAHQLRASVDANGFDQVEIIQRAVSDVAGRGRFEVSENAELSRLLADDETSAQSVGVDTTTLDRCRNELQWDRIDFIKIDAEGQEPHVVRGASRLLTDLSPLVMAEYKHGAELNLTLIEEFACLGYRAYRLIPGLGLLAPVSDMAVLDPYLLNLFFCKDSQAKALCVRGLLVTHDGASTQDFPPEDQGGADSHDDPDRSTKPANSLATNTTTAENQPIGNQAEVTLDLYARAQRTDLPPQDRLTALTQSLRHADSTASASPTIPNRITLGRIRSDYGLRNDAKDLLVEILTDLQQHRDLALDSPFLSPSKRFEGIERRGELRDWTIAAVAEWLASNIGYSSFFTAADSLRYLQFVRQTGYLEAEVQRRIDLILARRRSTRISVTPG